MSSSNMEAQVQQVIASMGNSFYETATLFVLWGVHITLACYAVYLLCNASGGGLRKSLPRQCMSGIVILMLAAGTSHVILLLKFFVIQIPNAMGQGSEIALRRRLNDYNVALGWLAKFNFFLSDLIVVWRAWALWSSNRLICWTLGISMAINAVCTTTNAIIVTVDSLRAVPSGSPSELMLPPSAQRSLLYIPLMGTNILATLLICYKAWMHRKDIQLFTADGNDERALTRNYRSSFRVGRILALFIETGTLYIALMTIYIMTSSGVFEGTIEGTMFTIAWGSVVPELSAIYPTVIIILVQKYMTQEDAISSSARHHKGEPLGNIRSIRAGRDNGNGALSTIQFDVPRLATQASLTGAPETMDLGGTGEKGNLATV